MSYLNADFADELIRNRIDSQIDPRPAMEEVSDYVLKVIGSEIPAYGYVISVESLELEGEGYVFCIFVKTPGEKRVYVSPTIYEEETACLSDCTTYLKNFPLYMFSGTRLSDAEKKNVEESFEEMFGEEDESGENSDNPEVSEAESSVN